MIDLAMDYLGLPQRNQLVCSASPCAAAENLRRMEDAGAPARLPPSLIEEQLDVESQDYPCLGVEAGAIGLVLFNHFAQPALDLERPTAVPRLPLSSSWEMLLRRHWTAILCGRIVAALAATGGVHTHLDVLTVEKAVACQPVHEGAEANSLYLPSDDEAKRCQGMG